MLAPVEPILYIQHATPDKSQLRFDFPLLPQSSVLIGSTISCSIREGAGETRPAGASPDVER
jgi:hypothetical protein